jgi:hypothetical protein
VRNEDHRHPGHPEGLESKHQQGGPNPWPPLSRLSHGSAADGRKAAANGAMDR